MPGDQERSPKKLAAHQIVASNRVGGLRVSFHLYHTLEDVRAVLNVLGKNLDLTVRD